MRSFGVREKSKAEMLSEVEEMLNTELLKFTMSFQSMERTVVFACGWIENAEYVGERTIEELSVRVSDVFMLTVCVGEEDESLIRAVSRAELRVLQGNSFHPQVS